MPVDPSHLLVVMWANGLNTLRFASKQMHDMKRSEIAYLLLDSEGFAEVVTTEYLSTSVNIS